MGQIIKSRAELLKMSETLCNHLDEMELSLNNIKKIYNKKYIDDYIISDFVDFTNGKITFDEIEFKAGKRHLLSDYLKKIMKNNFKDNTIEMMNDPVVRGIIKDESYMFLEEIICPIVKKCGATELKEIGFKFRQVAVEGNSAILGAEYAQFIEEQSLVMSYSDINEISIPVRWENCQTILSEAHEELNYDKGEDIIVSNMDDLSSYCNLPNYFYR